MGTRIQKADRLPSDLKELALRNGSAPIPSVPEALNVLERLRLEVRTAPTLEAINAISDAAAGLQRMFTSVKLVADSAGRTWTDAEARLGEELAKLPKAKGARAGGKKTAPRGYLCRTA